MTGKAGRSGRPRLADETKAYQVRVPVEEAEAFDALVQRRSMAATGTPDSLSSASVLRGLMRAAVEADRAAGEPKKGPKK